MKKQHKKKHREEVLQPKKKVSKDSMEAEGEAGSSEYPEHLSKINYLSVDSFTNSLEDQASYREYHDAMVENRYLFEGKTAMHITEGINCLYSFFAVEAGCKKVYCVLNGDSEKEKQNIFMMQEIIRQNNHQDKIEVLSWKDFNHQVDIIIGEPMGYCMHFDGMLDRMIEARDLFLTKKGHMFPNTLSFKCAIIHDEHFYDHKVQFWNDVYGIPMTSMKQWISREPIIRVVDQSLVVSNIAKILTFNLEKVRYEEIIKIDRIFQLELLNYNKANGLTFWFEATFDHGIDKREIKACPWSQSTKFTHVTLYWPLVEEFKGGKIRIRVKGQKYPKEGHSIISTEIDCKKYQYSFS